MAARGAKYYPAGATFNDDPVVLDDGSPGPLFVMQGVSGIEAPPWKVTLTTTPGVGGARWDRTERGVRNIKMPVHIGAGSRVEMRQLKSDLIAAINPESGPGVLMLEDAVGTEHGAVRCVEAVYNGGLEGDESAIKVGSGATWWEFNVEFLGLDNWYTPEASVASWRGRQAAANAFYADRWSASSWSIAPYGVEVVEPLELDGDTEAWPTFTLSGPWSRVRFTNDATGLWWEKVRAQSDETIVVDTKPGRVSVRNLFGENRYGFTAGSQLFPVRPAAGNRAADSVSVAVDGTSASTLLELSVNAAWLTAP